MEVLEIYTKEIVDSAENNELISNTLGVKGHEVNVLLENSNLRDVVLVFEVPMLPQFHMHGKSFRG